MEDYKQKYEQAFERAKGLYNSVFVNNDVLEQIFPELLKENEDYDEKIRKALINRFNESGELDGIPYDDIRSWLEKQGKVKHTCRNCQTFQDLHQNCPYSPIYQYTDLTDAHKHLDDETHCEFWLEKQGEQKSADKVEPKFKVGDWIVTPNNETKQIEKITFGNYYFTDKTLYNIIDTDNNDHLWTIEDAKDGDVLATDSDSICIFDGTVEDGKYPFAYCGLTGHYGFEVYDRKLPFTHNNDVNPATKEQRDLLFQKMKEAGYEWDAENKELKKIEQPSTAWSENDERMCKNLLFLMEQENSISSWEGCYEWLKSLKERMKGE